MFPRKNSGNNPDPISFQQKASLNRRRNAMLLAVAYSANIGGTGVITGSPPNLVVPQVI